MLETDHPIPKRPGAELWSTTEVPGAALVSLAQLLPTAGRKGRRPWAGFPAGGKQSKTILEPSPEKGMEGNSWDLRNEGCRSWSGLAASSVPAASSFSSLNYREDVCSSPLGSKISCPRLSIASLITALTKLQMTVISVEKSCNLT